MRFGLGGKISYKPYSNIHTIIFLDELFFNDASGKRIQKLSLVNSKAFFFAVRQNLSIVIKFLVSGLRIYSDCYRLQNKAGHQVFLGEYNAPDDFKCIWEKPLKTTPSWHAENLAPKVALERLFIFKKKLNVT